MDDMAANRLWEISGPPGEKETIKLITVFAVYPH
jgi:hypothetical protein